VEKLGELLHQAVGFLKNQDIRGRDFSRPYYPVCVLYFGKTAARYHPELLSDIRLGWGGGVEQMRFYVIKDMDTLGFKDPDLLNEISNQAFQEQLTLLLSQQNIFEDMSRLALYCIIDTTDLKSGEEFASWYLALERIKTIIGVPILSMLMVILNEGIEYTENAAQIKIKIAELYKNKDIGEVDSHIYDSVFIFGNRLKNGAFVMLDPSGDAYNDYNLFGDTVLLTNSSDSDHQKRRSRLYGNNKPALTAAYGHVQKPMYEIALITLKSITKRILEMIDSQLISVDVLAAALKINNGRSDIYEQLYSEIKPFLPDGDFLSYLPGKIAAASSYPEADKISDGCLQAFLEANHFQILKSELSSRKETLSDKIAKLLADALNAAGLCRGLPAQTLEAVFLRAETGLFDAANLNVRMAIEVKVKAKIAEYMKEIINQALENAIEEAKGCYNAFKSVIDDLDMIYVIGEEGIRKNLTSTYLPKVQRFYNDGNKLNNLFRNIFLLSNQRSDILDILLEAMKSCFANDDDYQLSYFDELSKRLGHLVDTTQAQEFIGNELINNLSERISFYSRNVFQERVFEAYFLNTNTKTGENKNLLYKYLDDREIPPEVERTFFNTCNNDKAESIWFYILTEDNLQR
jgi:hypothetical protein